MDKQRIFKELHNQITFIGRCILIVYTFLLLSIQSGDIAYSDSGPIDNITFASSFFHNSYSHELQRIQRSRSKPSPIIRHSHIKINNGTGGKYHIINPSTPEEILLFKVKTDIQNKVFAHISQYIISYFAQSSLNSVIPSILIVDDIYETQFKKTIQHLSGVYFRSSQLIVLNHSSKPNVILHEFAHAFATSYNTSPLEPLLAYIFGYYTKYNALPQSYKDIDTYKSLYENTQNNIPDNEKLGEQYFLENTKELFACAFAGASIKGHPYIIPGNIIAQLVSQYTQDTKFNTQQFSDIIETIRDVASLNSQQNTLSFISQRISNSKNRTQQLQHKISQNYLEDMFNQMYQHKQIELFKSYHQFIIKLIVPIVLFIWSSYNFYIVISKLLN